MKLKKLKLIGITFFLALSSFTATNIFAQAANSGIGQESDGISLNSGLHVLGVCFLIYLVLKFSFERRGKHG